MSNQDRMDSILFFIETINNSIEIGDFETANLNFAKLVEAMHQQNEFMGNVNPRLVADTERKYEEFRRKHNLTYPNALLPLNKNYDNTKKYETSNLYLKMYNVMYCIYDMNNCGYLNTLLKLQQDLIDSLNYLRKSKNIPDYELQADKAVDFYILNNQEHEIYATEEQINCIKYPEIFDENEFFNNCLIECYENFYVYWKRELNKMKRKNFIIKRINYLLDETEKYFSIAKKYRNMKLIDKVETTKLEYINRLSEINN